MTREKALRKAGLAAVILLAPGGFILGATLLARHYSKRSENDPLPPDGGGAEGDGGGGLPTGV